MYLYILRLSLFVVCIMMFVIFYGGSRQRNSPLLNIKFIKMTVYSPTVKKSWTGSRALMKAPPNARLLNCLFVELFVEEF